MPCPVSLTLISTCAPDALRGGPRRGRRAGVNLTRSRAGSRPPAGAGRGRPMTGPAPGSSDGLAARTPLASAAGRTVSSAASTTGAEVDRRGSEPELAGDDARDVEQVLDELGLRPRVALDGLERARRSARGVELAAAEQLRPAEHGVERRAQLVRDGRQELVLDAGWPPRPRRAPSCSRPSSRARSSSTRFWSSMSVQVPNQRTTRPSASRTGRARPRNQR